MRSLAPQSYGEMAGTPTSRAQGGIRQFGIVAGCQTPSGESDMEAVMGKYVVAWLLGVPAFVLVIVYMLAH
jgi:hypothetical protein